MVAIAEPVPQPNPKRARTPKVQAPVVEQPKPTTKRVRKPKAQAPAKPAVDLEPTADPGDPLAVISALPAAVAGDLSLDQRHDRYDILKRAVNASLRSFAVVGAALEEIREHEYWKLDRYPSWDEFLQTEWDLGGKQRATQLIQNARAFAALKQHLEARGAEVPLPVTESHVATLRRLETVEKQADAWQQAYATAERKAGDRLRLTADHIEKVVREFLGSTGLPDTGPGTNTPTPQERAPAKEQVPPTAEQPEDTTPPEDAAPPAGEEPDDLEGFVPDEGIADIVKEGGKIKTQTPEIALRYIIRGLKGGYFSHKDILVEALIEAVHGGLTTWLETPDDAVEVGYDEGIVPELVVQYDLGEDQQDDDANLVTDEE